MRQPLLLGMFLPIQSGGWSPSSLPRSTSWEFDDNARLTQRAEALGFDLAFGLAQWMGKGGTGGAIRFREQSLDPFITASSLAVITQRIILISTIHVLYGPWHPLYLAKLGATVDHISHGRWVLNVVTGFVPSEARMFGNEQIEHDQRYAMADEFIELMKALWASRNNLSRDGRYWRLIDAFVTPKPSFGRPYSSECDGVAGWYRLRGQALRSRIHHKSGRRLCRCRDRRLARAQRGDQSQGGGVWPEGTHNHQSDDHLPAYRERSARLLRGHRCKRGYRSHRRLSRAEGKW